MNPGAARGLWSRLFRYGAVLVAAACLTPALPASVFAEAPGAAAEARLATLPAEARQTLDLVKQGGPFPYRRDGSVFSNRERRLPPHSRGYYREYIVPTPSASDRGARRIIAGAPGEYYYTGDHYASFQRIVP